MNPEYVVDCLVRLDGENPSFYSLMPHEKALEIQNNGGLSECSQIILRETPERPIPESVKKGEACITDILVRLEPNMCIFLN